MSNTQNIGELVGQASTLFYNEKTKLLDGVFDEKQAQEIGDKIEALIALHTNEARIELIEEILELPDTNGGCEDSHVKAKFTSWFDDRLAQLKENNDE